MMNIQIICIIQWKLQESSHDSIQNTHEAKLDVAFFIIMYFNFILAKRKNVWTLSNRFIQNIS